MMIIFNASNRNVRYPAEAISTGGEAKKSKTVWLDIMLILCHRSQATFESTREGAEVN